MQNKNKKLKRMKKIICGCLIGTMVTGCTILTEQAFVLADTQETIVCDDTTCWKLSVTVPDELSVGVGEKEKIKAEYKETEGIDVTYQSLNTSIATVSAKGKVTGKKAGTVQIATTISGEHVQKELTFTTKVVVTESSFEIVTPKKQVKVGKSITLKVKNCEKGKEVVWSVNKKAIANIGKATGKLTGKKRGKVKVTATCGELKKSVTIKVQ